MHKSGRPSFASFITKPDGVSLFVRFGGKAVERPIDDFLNIRATLLMIENLERENGTLREANKELREANKELREANKELTEEVEATQEASEVAV